MYYYKVLWNVSTAFLKKRITTWVVFFVFFKSKNLINEIKPGHFQWVLCLIIPDKFYSLYAQKIQIAFGAVETFISVD